MKFVQAVVLFAFVAVATATEESYKGYKVYDLKASSAAQLSTLRAISNIGLYDFWGKDRVLVKPDQIQTFEEILNRTGVEYSIFTDDVDEMVRKERMENQAALGRSTNRLSFTAYHRYAAMETYMNEMASKYPNLVKIETIGTTTQGRPLKAVRVSTGGNGNKPVVVVDAGIHAREWLAPATALYLLQELVENSSANKDMIDRLDWVIIPLLNPDGYEFTFTNNRFWRKTRSQNSGSSCYGVDGNRNFEYHWMEVGASSNPCADDFAGKKPFSEPEMRALGDVLLAENVKLYMTLHTYGQYILYPWGYTTALPDNWKDLDALGEEAAKALRAVSGTRYTVGSSTNTLYAAAGGSDDYALAVGKSPYSYTYELPGGGTGFDPPPSRILPVAKETMEAFRVMARKVADIYG